MRQRAPKTKKKIQCYRITVMNYCATGIYLGIKKATGSKLGVGWWGDEYDICDWVSIYQTLRRPGLRMVDSDVQSTDRSGLVAWEIAQMLMSQLLA
jgi:hypothetical protein